MTTSSYPTTRAPVCPLTGGPMNFWLHVPCDWRRPGLGAGYDLFWSARARFGQLHPRPTPAEVAASYAVDYYTHGDGPQPAAGRKRFTDRVREHLAWRADFGTDLTARRLGELVSGGHPTVLEIGCGAGGLLADLRAAGWAAVGVEPDPAARTVAAGRGLEVHDGTAEEPPDAIRDRAFDVVVMQHVLEHCLDPLAALRIGAGVLKPGGVMVIETPNNEAAGGRSAGAAWPWLDVPRHLNFFTAHSLKLACAAAGLIVTGAEYTGYTRQYQAPWADMERRIRASFREAGAEVAMPEPGRTAWVHLIRTALAAPRYKYDSVRVEARRRQTV